MEWTRSHINFPKYLTWRHDDTIRTVSFDHLIRLIPKGHFFNTQVCQSSCLPWSLVQKFLLRWIISLKCCYFERCFFWSSRFFCNVGEMKWSFGVKNMKHVRISICIHLQSVLLHWIWPWCHSVFYWTNAWCSVKLELKLITYAIYTCTQK